jgi:hypothetical protein
MAPPRAVAVDEQRGRVFVTAWGRTNATGFPTRRGVIDADAYERKVHDDDADDL